MKQLLLAGSIFLPAFLVAQPILRLTNVENEKSITFKEGDKILLAVKQATPERKNKPLSVYKLSPAELRDSQYVFTKGRISKITDSTIFLNEHNSLFSSSLREIRLNKINGLKKLSFGKQVFRTTALVGGGLALAVAGFYSYAAVGGGDGFVEGMLIAAPAGLVATQFGKTKMAKRHLDNWKMEVVKR